MRKIFFILWLMIALVSNATTIYLKPNSNWLSNNARFAIYSWNAEGSAWTDLSAEEGQEDIYQGNLVEGHTNMLFCRLSGSSTENTWGNVWNQTVDLTYDGVNNLYMIASDAWSKGGGEWSVYTKPESVDITIYVKRPELWNKVYYYVWDNNGNVISQNWPGTAVDEVESIDGESYCKYAFTDVAAPLNLIIGNGKDQTYDITGISETSYYVLDSEIGGGITVTERDETRGGISVFLSASAWSKVNYYAWDDAGNVLLGDWPGTEITEKIYRSGESFYVYTFPAEYESINIIFNNGVDQTLNLTNITQSLYFRLNGDSGNCITTTELDGFYDGAGGNAWPTNYSGVMLQGFYWDSYNDYGWNELVAMAPELSAYFDLIWVPNSAKAASGDYSMGYDPVYWMSNHNSAFGTEAELKKMVNTYKQYGTGIIEDVVINHRSGMSNWTDFPTETYKNVTYEWGAWAICCTDEVKNESGQAIPTGAADTGDDFDGSRDLDHTNAQVQSGIKAYLDYLKNEIGYIGWRYDMTKGYSGYYVGEYNKSIGTHYSVGEYWDSYDNIVSWIANTGYNSGAFDFPFKWAVNEAVGSGDYSKLVWLNGDVNQPAGLIHQNTYRPFAVTFVDNHDTYREDYYKMNGNVVEANAFLLSSPGTPCVFFPHWLEYKDEISRLIEIRKAVGITNNSIVEVLETAGDIYAAKVIGTNGSLIVKVGLRYEFTPPAGYELQVSGENYAIWTDCETARPIVSLSPESGVYLGGTAVTLSVENADEYTQIIYTTDGSIPNLQNGLRVKSGYQLEINESAIVTAVAVKGNDLVSSVVEQAYYTEETIDVYLEVPEWTTVNYYAWDTDGNRLLDEWPGTKITKTVTTTSGKKWYCHSFPVEDAGFNIIFNNGVDQTVDISNIVTTTFFSLDSYSGKDITATEVKFETVGLDEVINEGQVSVVVTPSAILIGEEATSISVYSVGGVKMASASHADMIDISSLGSGLYLYVVESASGGISHGKFVK